MRTALPLFDARAEQRADATRAEHAFWPCAPGCADCCRSLSTAPRVTEPEWRRIAEALSSWPEEERREVIAKVMALGARGPLVCPFLAEPQGLCRLYEARPLECRTYGYYTERDGGLHCNTVSEAVARAEAEGGEPPAVVWGNGEAFARDAARALGEARPLAAWLAPK